MKIELKPNQKLWFTSDTHYNHSNICSATTNWAVNADDYRVRDFTSLDEMNTTIVNNINSLVGEDDILIHLGDWSFGGFESIAELRSRIVCKNIHIVLGNHDHHILNNRDNIRDLFSSVHEFLDLSVVIPSKFKNTKSEKYNFICMHYPIASWKDMNHGNIHLHGHTHLSPKNRIHKGRAIDVGVEGNNLYPIEMKEVIKLVGNNSISTLVLPADHHAERL